jgi:hypothetical protein
MEPVSFDATANCSPFGLKAAAVIPRSPVSTANGSVVVRDQTRTVPSAEPEAIVSPSGLNARALMPPSWPINSRTRANVCEFQRRMWPFTAPLAIWLPSGLKATLLALAEWPHSLPSDAPLAISQMERSC